MIHLFENIFIKKFLLDLDLIYIIGFSIIKFLEIENYFNIFNSSSILLLNISFKFYFLGYEELFYLIRNLLSISDKLITFILIIYSLSIGIYFKLIFIF